MPILPELSPADASSLSPSRINSYLLCSLKYRFAYVDELPRPWKSAALAFGSAVHSALEAWQLSRLSGDELSADDVEQTFLADWEAEKSGDLLFKDDEEPDQLRDRGVHLIRGALDLLRPDFPEAAELPFTVDIVNGDADAEPLTLRGVFDLLLQGDRLVEIKTSSRRYDRDLLERHLQLTAYAYAYRKLTGRDARLEVLTLLKTRTPKVELVGAHRTPEALDWFVALTRKVHAGIRAQSFFPNPSWMCSDCEYAEACRAWRG
jgi:putative RecB family exonuclease